MHCKGIVADMMTNAAFQLNFNVKYTVNVLFYPPTLHCSGAMRYTDEIRIHIRSK